jgi:hypothetical protein
MGVAAPDLVDNQVVHNDEQRLESSSGFFGIAPEVEEVEQKISVSMLLYIRGGKLECPAVIVCPQTFLQTFIQFLEAQRLYNQCNIKVAEHSDIGRKVYVDAQRFEIIHGGCIGNDLVVGGLCIVKGFPWRLRSLLGAREKGGATGTENNEKNE